MRRPLLALTCAFATSGAGACMEPDWSLDLAVVHAETKAAIAYAQRQHDAGDPAMERSLEANGRMVEIARRCGQRCPTELRVALFEFVLANAMSADEQVSEAALALFEQWPAGFCRDLAARPEAEKTALIERARTGAALTQAEPIPVACP